MDQDVFGDVRNDHTVIMERLVSDVSKHGIKNAAVKFEID